jgi:hypothetical protein
MKIRTKKIEAKDKDGNVVGRGTCLVFDSMNQAVKHLGEEKALRDLNRQTETDAKNALRRPVDPVTVLRRMAKADPKVAAQIAAIVAENSTPDDVA